MLPSVTCPVTSPSSLIAGVPDQTELPLRAAVTLKESPDHPAEALRASRLLPMRSDRSFAPVPLAGLVLQPTPRAARTYCCIGLMLSGMSLLVASYPWSVKITL